MITLIKLIAIALLFVVAATVATFVYNLYSVLREAQSFRLIAARSMA